LKWKRVCKKIDTTIEESEIANRRDMRYVDFTIDPKDAKDFDDALSLKN
jgi:ribonuclease R